MIPLVIDGVKINILKSFAEAHPIPLEELKQIVAGKAPAPGEHEGHACLLDFGFRLVFSIEEHPRSDGTGTTWLRHMSVSLTEPTGTRVPSVNAVRLLAEALGFKPLEACMVNLVEDATPQYVEVLCEK